MIVEATAKLMRSDPQTPVTMARVAEFVDATPMAIYRYVSDREDLLGAVRDHVLGQLSHDIPPDAGWQEQLRAWMTSLYEHLVQYPECATRLKAGDALVGSWMHSTAILVEILQSAGLSGLELVESVHWITFSTMGRVVLDIGASGPSGPGGFKAGLEQASPEDVKVLRALNRHVDRVWRNGFSYMIDRTIEGLETTLAR